MAEGWVRVRFIARVDGYGVNDVANVPARKAARYIALGLARREDFRSAIVTK